MLWDRDNWDPNSHPAHNPDVRLFDSRQRKDLLVIYEEQRNHRRTEPRAYWLYENQYLVEREHRPAFVRTNMAIGLTPVSVFTGTNAVATNSPETLSAVMTSHYEFSLYSGAQEVSSHRLPFYDDGRQTAARVALTPLALVADATVIGGVVFLIIYVHPNTCCD
jgi:hypothetical protein